MKHLRSASLFVIASLCAHAQEGPPPAAPAVSQVDLTSLAAVSGGKDRVVIGAVADESGHGHVVVVVPGTNRVYDGNILGALNDAVGGRDINNPAVQAKLERYLTKEYGTPAQYQDLVAKKGGAITLDKLLADKSPEERSLVAQKLLDSYLKKGNTWTQSFDAKHPEKVQWYSVPGDPAKAMAAVSKWTPPTPRNAEEQNLRCNDLVKAVAPVVKEIVAEGKSVTANTITQGLRTADETSRKAEPAPPVARPPEPDHKPIIEDKSREQKVVPKPGGVILAPQPSIEGLAPEQISGAGFDAATGVLVFTLKGEGRVTYEADADDLAIAVRSVLDRGVDPSLSMRWCDKPGYHAVDYCGPLFRTKFGKILYETDKILGAIIFNREGAHQATVADLIPGYAELAGEAHATMMTGSRVFLRAAAASFAVKEGRLVPAAGSCVIDVEGIGYGASYYQESLHRLARALDRNFDALSEAFEPFQEFRRLARLVALVKWMKQNSIAFDASSLKDRQVAVHEFPAYEPTANWYTMFNGRNLDGWKCNLGSNGVESAGSEGSLAVRPMGTAALEIFADTWAKNYDLRYTLSTEGPVEIVIRNGAGEQGAAITIDTKGAAQTVEGFLSDGTWTFLAPGAGSKGSVRIPEPAKDKPSEANRYGLRVPPGSKVTLFTASLRTR